MAEGIVVDVVSGVITDSLNRPGCFPSSAQVRTPQGARVVSSVSVGDTLLTSQGFAPVFLQGHQNALAVSQMVKLVTASNHTLTLTPNHYLPLASGTYVSAGRVSLGDELLVQSDGCAVPMGCLTPSTVVAVSRVEESGLWNPFTTTGDLVVNGVLASSHSDWFLEGSPRLTEDSIVRVYQAVLSPVRMLYAIAPAWLARFAAAFQDSGPALSQVGVVEILSKAGQTLLQV